MELLPIERGHELPAKELLELAADECGSYAAVARNSGISRRRLHYIKLGHAISKAERHVLDAIAHRRM